MLRVAIGLAIAGLLTCHAGAAQKRSRARTPVEPTATTAASYNAAWLPIRSCADFKRKLWALPTAEDLLQPAIASEAARKSEFETTDEWRQRVRKELSTYLTPEKVYLIHPLDRTWSKYNAEKQELIIAFPEYVRSGYIPLYFTLASQNKNGSTYRASNAFGVTRNVQRKYQSTQAVDYTFPKATTTSTIRTSMNSNDAELFTRGIGTLHILAEIKSTNIRRVFSSPTLQEPVERRGIQYEASLQPRCAYITFGPELVEGWNYETW